MTTIRQNIERLLACTAQATALKARVDVLRTNLYAEAMRRLEEDGAAPTWNARGAGVVRLDGANADRKATVVDPDAYASWVAENAPAYATGVVELDPGQLETALEALTFAGITPRRTRVDVDPSYTGALLDGLDLIVEPGGLADGVPLNDVVTAQRVDETTGEATTVPGIGALPAPAPRLVVNLDPQVKRDLVADALAQLELEEADDDVAEVAQLEAAEVEGEQAERFRDEVDAVEHAGANTELARARAEAVEESGEEAVREVEATITGPLVDLAEHRNPYVGEGADGARRSAEIDRTEADGLDRGDHRREELLVSAIRWEQQADELEQGANVEEGTSSAAARDAARRTLAQLVASDVAWDSAKAADLHRLKLAADLGLGKGKVAKAVLRTQLTDALGTFREEGGA